MSKTKIALPNPLIESYPHVSDPYLVKTLDRIGQHAIRNLADSGWTRDITRADVLNAEREVNGEGFFEKIALLPENRDLNPFEKSNECVSLDERSFTINNMLRHITSYLIEAYREMWNNTPIVKQNTYQRWADELIEDFDEKVEAFYKRHREGLARLAVSMGFPMNTEVVDSEGRHFTVATQYHGKPVKIHIHADGSNGAKSVFGSERVTMTMTDSDGHKRKNFDSFFKEISLLEELALLDHSLPAYMTDKNKEVISFLTIYAPSFVSHIVKHLDDIA